LSVTFLVHSYPKQTKFRGKWTREARPVHACTRAFRRRCPQDENPFVFGLPLHWHRSVVVSFSLKLLRAAP
uniref:Uncharacterized protein n=1 Tax=Cucumis melo TaxID=3656 RepID=A0A9I9E115_CUCME